MKPLFFIVFLSISFSLFSQASLLVTIKGRVVDKDRSPIAFVNLSLLSDPSIGTHSNTGGEFEIKLTSINSKDSLLFSSIGYENGRLSLSDPLIAKDSIVITLKSKTYLLSEIVFSSDTALLIVKKSIERLNTTLASDKNILQGFYREIVRSDHTYDRLVEAAVDVFDNGYKSSKDQELQFKIREIRKSDDLRDLDWFQSIINYIAPPNGLHGHFESLFFNDYIRHNDNYYHNMVNTTLNDEYLDDTILNLDSSTVYNGDKVWCISIHPKHEDRDFLPTGLLYIRQQDFAILEMQSEVKVNSDLPTNFAVPGQEYMHRTVIKYKEYQGKMYLSFIYRKAFRFDMNSTKFKKSKKKEGLFFNEYLFVTNEIITERDKVKKFKKKERQKEDKDLYSTDWKYNEAFWKTYNALNERPLEPNVKKDIERESQLDEQFKKNE